MAIPPVLANNPLLKLFKSNPADHAGKPETPAAPQTREDIVELSTLAQQRLNGIEKLSAENPERIQEVAGEVRETLQDNDSLTLGSDTDSSS